MKTVAWANSKVVGSNDYIILVSVREHQKQTLDQTVPKDIVNVTEVHEQKEDEKTEQVLTKFKELLPTRNVAIKVLRGDKRKELTKYINDLEPNFVVVGAREMSGIKRAFSSSTTEYLAQHVNVPVMIYRPGTHVSEIQSGQGTQQASEQTCQECGCAECHCAPGECHKGQESQTEDVKNMEKEGRRMEEEGRRIQQRAREMQGGGVSSAVQESGVVDTSAMKGQEVPIQGQPETQAMQGQGRQQRGPRVICIPCDLGEHSMKTVEWANSKVVGSNDHVILVSVREHRKQTLDQNVPKDVVDVSEVHSQKEDEKVEEVLNKFKAQMHDVDVEIKVLRGDKRNELVNYINALGPNFVLVGAREMSGIKRTFSNSTSEYLAQHLNVPVMIYHPFAKSK
jgi:nucleotide-binding universal stress UspA family protein